MSENFDKLMENINPKYQEHQETSKMRKQRTKL